jgi:hypothetical protein
MSGNRPGDKNKYPRNILISEFRTTLQNWLYTYRDWNYLEVHAVRTG